MAETQFRMSIDPCAIVQAESWPATLPAFETELSRQLGGKLPATSRETTIIGHWLAVRVAPRRFWFIADEGSELHCSIDPEHGCLLSLKESRMRLRLSGPHPHTSNILSACVAIDWHEAKPGHAFQTSFHHVPVLVLRTAADACDLFVPRSFARSLAEWVADIAAPYEATVSAKVPA
jgi:heterotetrameric sarcosine oxidase gamma subunit